MALTPAEGPGWGPLEVLCHLVHWHETYVSILHALNRGRVPRLEAGAFSELNEAAVRQLRAVPAPFLIGRLRRAQRRLTVELLEISPSARVRIKAGSKARGPREFAARIESHVRGHLEQIRLEAR